MSGHTLFSAVREARRQRRGQAPPPFEEERAAQELFELLSDGYWEWKDAPARKKEYYREHARQLLEMAGSRSQGATGYRVRLAAEGVGLALGDLPERFLPLDAARALGEVLLSLTRD